MTIADQIRSQMQGGSTEQKPQSIADRIRSQINQNPAQHGSATIADRIRSQMKQGVAERREPAPQHNGLTQQQFNEAQANKQGAFGSFLKGFTHNYDEYAATINKGLDWVADKWAGHDTHYFDDSINYWNVKRRQNEIETANHPYAKLAGSILLDPLNFTPTGVVSKGSKLARMAKSAAMGVPVGYGVSAVKNYGNTDISDEEKARENAVSAGLVGVLNGVIAGLTKGKVTNAIKDIEHLQGDGKEMADKAIEALANNPEAFGLSKAQAKKAADDYAKISEMKWSRASKREASKMFSVFHNDKAGTVVKANGGDIHVTPEIAEKIRSKHLDDPAKRGMVTTSEAISFPKVVRNVEPEALRQGETWIAHADDGNKLVYGVGEWDGSKKLKTIYSKTEKGERGQLHREFNDRDFHDSALPDNSIAQGEEGGQDIFSHPRAEEAIELARDRYAKQTYYDRVGGDASWWFAPDGSYMRAGVKGEKNYHQGFHLTKADVKKIDRGKITPEIEEKLRLDIERLENDPAWNPPEETPSTQQVHLDEEGNLVDSETGNMLFASPGHRLATGFGVGTYNAFAGEYDPNRDLSTQVAEKFIHGMALGLLGAQSLRMLAKHNPAAFEKVRSYFREQGVKPGDDLSRHQGVRLGVFAGSEAKGFEKAANKHVGKYDMRPRFEIDDSVMNVRKPDLAELMSRDGNTKRLDEVIDHPELFANYPELRGVNVEFKKDLRGNAAFDGKDTIFISNKFKSPDEVGSSLIHEVQHWVQGKEGFAGGGSYDAMLRQVEGRIYDLEKRGDLSPLEAMRYSEELSRLKGNKSAEAYERYKKIAGEIEAREVQARQHLTPEERDIIPPYENAETLAADGSPEAYNTALMAHLEGRHGDFDSAGIAPEEATLDFSNSRADMAPVKSKGQKEKRGIYNVTFNDKKSTPIRKDIDEIEDAIKYELGYENKRTKRGYGAIHIQKHIGNDKDGWVTKEELLNIGEAIRNTQPYKKNGKDVYEFYGDDGTRFRVIVGERNNKEKVITFYSNRRAGEENNTLTYIYPGSSPTRDGHDIPQITNDLAGRTEGGTARGLQPSSDKEIIPQQDGGVKIGMFAGDAPKLRKGSANGKLSHLARLVEEETSREWKDISKTFVGHARLLFTDTFSGDYIKARDITTAAKHRAAEKASLLHGTLSKLPEQDRKLLHEYIVGDIPANSVPESLRSIGDNIRQTVTDIQEQLIDAGFSEEMINAWGENYLKRLYEIHPVKDFKNALTKKMTIPQLLRRGKEETISIDEFKRRVREGEINRNQIGKPLKEGGIEIKDLGNGRVKVRRDWTKAEREQMGEITDAAVTVPQTIVHLHNILEHAKFLKEVSGIDGATIDPKIAKALTDDEISSMGFVRVPNTQKYGALAGQVVRKDVFGDIKALNDNVFDTYFGSDNEVAKAWKGYLRLWKKSKTVWNAPTHFNNLTSNFFLMHLAGLNPVEIIRNVASAGKMMSKGKRLTELESKAILNTLTDSERTELNALNSELRYYKEAKDLGLLNTSFLEDIGRTPKDTVDAKTVLGKVDKTLTRWYQNEDAVNKLAMFKFLRENGWTKEKSREAVEMIMPDYSRPMAQAWRFLRDTGVTPFIAWTYYTFPKMLRLIKSARGATQAATALGALYGLQYATTGTFNPMDDSIPDDFQLSRIGVSRDGDRVTTLKVDRMIPYMQPMNPKRFARDFVGSSPLMTVVSGIMGNKIYNGRPITNDYKPKSQQAYDYVKYLTQGLTPIPGQVSSTWDVIESLVRSKRNRVRSSDIVPRTPTQEVLKLIGINSLTYDKRKVMRKRMQGERRRKKAEARQ